MRELARGACGAGELADAPVRIKRSNPMCGDEVLLTLRLSGRRVAELAHRTRGCLLCKASAAMLAGMAEQCEGDLAKLAQLRAALDAMLAGGDVPADMRMFAPVASRPARLLCVQLPWHALSEAVLRR